MPNYDTIISATDLSVNLSNPDWVIFDCRFNLANPSWGFEDYQRSHIQGALFADLNLDLASPIRPDTGRHPLPETNAFIAFLQKSGVSNHTQVIAYDTVGGAFAARLWLLLKMVGHQNVAVLDGGFAYWQSLDLPVSSGIETSPSAVFSPQINTNLTITTQQMEAIIHDPAYLVIDARSAERYRGETEPIDPIAGHIPGAVNRFHGANLGKDNCFLPDAELYSQFTTLLGNHRPSQVVLYCGSGVTSIHHKIVMDKIGLPGSRIYIGSWSEWIRNPEHGIAKEA